MTSLDNRYGLASGIVDPDRPAKRHTPCPRCGGPLRGDPVVFWCQAGHSFTAVDLEEHAELQRHRQCEALAAADAKGDRR